MLRVDIKTDNPEKILSELVRERIEVSTPQKTDNGICFLIPTVYYPRLRQAEKTSEFTSRVTPLGLLGFLARKKRRTGLVIGALIGIFLIYLSTFYVWSVTIEGEGYVPESEILETLEYHGFKTGVMKKRVDVNEVAQSFLADREEFSFCTINISGAVAHVELSLRERTRHAEDAHDPYNLVSDADGVIVRLEVENGISAVTVGDSVHKGQLLVSGIMENTTNTAFRLVRSEGRVWAKVNKVLTFNVPLEYVEKKYTDEKYVSTLRILGHRIGFRRLPKSGDYDIITNTETPTVFGYELPFEVEKIMYAFWVEKTVTLTENEALIKAHDLYRKRAVTEFDGATVLDEVFSHEINGGTLTLTCEISAIEEISTRQKIQIK